MKINIFQKTERTAGPSQTVVFPKQNKHSWKRNSSSVIDAPLSALCIQSYVRHSIFLKYSLNAGSASKPYWLALWPAVIWMFSNWYFIIVPATYRAWAAFTMSIVEYNSALDHTLNFSPAWGLQLYLQLYLYKLSLMLIFTNWSHLSLSRLYQS